MRRKRGDIAEYDRVGSCVTKVPLAAGSVRGWPAAAGRPGERGPLPGMVGERPCFRSARAVAGGFDGEPGCAGRQLTGSVDTASAASRTAWPGTIFRSPRLVCDPLPMPKLVAPAVKVNALPLVAM